MSISCRRALASLAFLACAAAQAATIDVEAHLRNILGRRDWYGVYVMGQKSGYALVEVTATEVGGRAAVAYGLNAHFKLTALGKQQDIDLVEKRVFFRTGELHSVSNRFKTDSSDVEISGVVEGGKLILSSRMGKLTNRKEFPAPKETLADALADQELIAPDAKVGARVTVSQFEPMMLKEVEATVTLKERKRLVFNGVPTEVSVLTTSLPDLGVSSESFVDEHGTALELTVGQMFVLRLEPEKQAKDIQYSGDLIRLGCIPLNPHPKQVASVQRIRFQVTGVEDPTLLISDERQRWTKQGDGSYIIASQTVGIEPARVAKLPVDRAKFAADLAPSLFAQSDDARVKALAAEIVGGERDSYAAARKINQWVYKSIRKVGTAALSNAVETLGSREGDCTEHTVLFVALARAAGIPAREVAGVVAIEGGEGLYYHAWPEVWVGRWVAMDPTLGQDLADATHIKFSQGESEQLFRIIAFFGRLKAKVLDSATE